ncbi:plasmid partitioning protein RepB [Rhizobium sp. WYJ-E13]|uniref:plasmid partitioning protein RepB n=1 Tax=Rhizobium sp. WYJ-E13 TaxID=2849093 RepID=UPI001C1EC4A9|nr:plasmid partitioning protein RepB [Rhizobium sp. WYJ-E13]QWW72320.1 plasmid partitioning protein RepB [Rhizobium sp. WYJ-E13]
MSKRTQSIRSMFAGGDDAQPRDGRAPFQRVASGAVRSLQDTFSEVERDYEALKQRIAEGALPVELNTDLIDPSPFSDRFSDQDTAAIEALKASIEEHGQEIPILVRPHPASPGRYQIAYGHRRLRVASELGRPVKAYVRNLDDQRLVVAQGIENSAREDLSFIERATFAQRLEGAGFQRALIQAALSVDKAEVSKLIAVAQALPDWIVAAIGRGPKIGRGRWQELAELVKQPGSEAKARKAIDHKTFAHKDAEARLKAIVQALKEIEKPKRTETAVPDVAKSADGTEIARLSISARHCKIEMSRERDEAFAAFLMARLPDLYASFKNDKTVS